MTNKRLSALTSKHSALEAQIEAERARLRPDDLKIQDLKRQKLAIKDELAA